MRFFARLLFGILALIAMALLAFWLVSRPNKPGLFYTYKGAPADKPGMLLAQEPVTIGVPDGATVTRILYSTTRPDGSAAVASAIVAVPKNAAGEVPLVAYAHGTTGVRPGCAPSVFDNHFPNVPGFPALLEQGWAYVGTDYVGLGTRGGHLYMVGDDAARAVLDSIRAAHHLPGTKFTAETVVWGHSQGGHSVLWTGSHAADYAPDVAIAGVAAVSPASDLPSLVENAGNGPFGKIVSAYLVDAYDRAYPEIGAWSYVDPWARLLVRDIASRCIESPDILFSLGELYLLPEGGMFERSPLQGEFAEKLAENIPLGPFPMPLMIAQGATDDLVLPPVQTGYVRRLCEDGVALDYRLYEGQDHISVVQPGSPLTEDLIAWTRDRFEERDFEGNCAVR